jgi:hypothetical protein
VRRSGVRVGLFQAFRFFFGGLLRRNGFFLSHDLSPVFIFARWYERIFGSGKEDKARAQGMDSSVHDRARAAV